MKHSRIPRGLLAQVGRSALRSLGGDRVASRMRFLAPILSVNLRHPDVGYVCRLGNAGLESHGIVCIIGLVCVRHGVHRTVVSGAVLLFVCQPANICCRENVICIAESERRGF